MNSTRPDRSLVNIGSGTSCYLRHNWLRSLLLRACLRANKNLYKCHTSTLVAILVVREGLLGAPWASLFRRQGYTLEIRITSPTSGGTSAWSLNNATFTGVWSCSSKTPRKTILWFASPRYFTGESWNRKHRSQVFMRMAQLIWWVYAIWWYKYGSTLSYIMACCLTVQSHYPTNVDFLWQQSIGIVVNAISLEYIEWFNLGVRVIIYYGLF